MSEEKYDVCVVGGGLIGLCSAYQLAKKNYGVVVVERAERLASEASANNGGVTWPFMQMLSEPFLYQFVRDGIEAHKRLFREGLKYDFRLIGAIQTFFTAEEMKYLEKKLETMPSTERYQVLDKKELHDLEPTYSSEIVGGILFPNCSQGLTYKLASELTKGMTKYGVETKTSTQVKSFRREDNKKIKAAITNHGEITAEYFVLSAGPWCSTFSDDLSFGIPTIPIKGHIITWRPTSPITSHLMLPRRGAVLPTPDGFVRAGGGMDFTGYDKTPNERVVKILSSSAIEAIPSLVNLQFEVWAGLRPGTPDALPILGYAEPYENLVIAAGHYHEGFSTCAITGEIVSDLVAKGKSELPYLDIYRPSRFNC